jgi:hypothetical protein
MRLPPQAVLLLGVHFPDFSSCALHLALFFFRFIDTGAIAVIKTRS